MNTAITKTKKKAKNKILALAFLNNLAAAMGSLSIVLSLTFIGLGVSLWKIGLFVLISCLPAALLLLFKAVR